MASQLFIMCVWPWSYVIFACFIYSLIDMPGHEHILMLVPWYRYPFFFKRIIKEKLLLASKVSMVFPTICKSCADIIFLKVELLFNIINVYAWYKLSYVTNQILTVRCLRPAIISKPFPCHKFLINSLNIIL